MKTFEEYREYVEKHLLDVFPGREENAGVLYDSMIYSLTAGGKRLRPVLLIASCELAGGSAEEAMPYASAIEYIHTYSLIHDDLPAMDNDDLRRGMKTNHVVFGAGMATLAGDGLLNTAFEVMANDIRKAAADGDEVKGRIDAECEIAKGAGVSGMVAGQAADIRAENGDGGQELLRYIQLNKTAALIRAAVRSGLFIGEASEEMLSGMTRYAEDLGIAFQIADDILDVRSTTEELGKPVGSDEENGKLTFVSLNGLDRSYEELKKLTDEAVASASPFDSEGFFTGLALGLEKRTR